VEFNPADFPNRPPGSIGGQGAAAVAPLDAYNLDTLSNKNRDFSNPMYDAVQSGTADPNIGNGSGEYC
jgi:low density lipoprotein-related protein 2